MAEPLSLGQLGRVLLRYWILIVVGTVLGAGLAFGVTRLMTPVYQATAIQLVKGLPGSGTAANYEAAQYAVGRAKTYPSFVYNLDVLQNVRDDLDGLRSVNQLRSDLTASNPVGTPLLEITAVGPTPREAADKANSAARHLAVFITEIETVGNKSPISVELAVQAAPPTEAAAPKTLVITALGGLIGFALATVTALLNSYIRFQRRSAFRRRQAISWVKKDASAEAAAGPTPVAADAATEPRDADADRPPEAEPASAPDDQPALVEADDTELVRVTAETQQTQDQEPVTAEPATLGRNPAAEGESRYDTINLGLLGLSGASGHSSNGSSTGWPVKYASSLPAELAEAAKTAHTASPADDEDATAEDEQDEGAAAIAADHAAPVTAAGEDEDEDEIPIDGDATVLVMSPAADNADQVATTDVEEEGETTHPAEDEHDEGAATAADDAATVTAAGEGEDEDEIPIDGDATVLVMSPAADNVDQVGTTDVEEEGETTHPAAAEDEYEFPLDGDPTVYITLPPSETADLVATTDVKEEGETSEHVDGSKEPAAR